MSKKKMESLDVMNLIINEVVLPLRDKPTENNLKKLWKPVFLKILREYYGFNKKAAKTMFKWGKYGHNWKELHHDCSKSKKEVIQDFISELSYISDRISLDRLLRTHHIYNQYFAIVRHKAFLKEYPQYKEAS